MDITERSLLFKSSPYLLNYSCSPCIKVLLRQHTLNPTVSFSTVSYFQNNAQLWVEFLTSADATGSGVPYPVTPSAVADSLSQFGNVTSN